MLHSHEDSQSGKNTMNAKDHKSMVLIERGKKEGSVTKLVKPLFAIML